MIGRGANLKEVGLNVFIVSFHWCSVVLSTVNCCFNRDKLSTIRLFQISD